jgi:hypothetical protein
VLEGISDERSTSSRSSSTLPVKSGNESSHDSPQPANKKSKGPSKLRMEVEIPALAKRIKQDRNRESIKRKRSPSEPLEPESETEAPEEADNHSSYEPPVEFLEPQYSDEEHHEPSPIPMPPRKKTKRAISEEVLPPPPTIPKGIKKRVVLKSNFLLYLRHIIQLIFLNSSHPTTSSRFPTYLRRPAFAARPFPNSTSRRSRGGFTGP